MFLNSRFSTCIFFLFQLGFTDVGSGVTVWFFLILTNIRKHVFDPSNTWSMIETKKLFLNGKIIITVLKRVMFSVWNGFRILFQPLGPSREAARCTLSISELFFLHFSFVFCFCVKKWILFFEEDFWKTHSHKKRGHVEPRSRLCFPAWCLFLPRCSRKTCGWCFLFLPHSPPPSFLLQGCGAWVLLIGLFFLLVVLLSLPPLGGVAFSLSSLREVLLFPSFFCVVLLGPLEWCHSSFWLPLFWVVLLQRCKFSVFFLLSIFPWQVFGCIVIFEKTSVVRP